MRLRSLACALGLLSTACTKQKTTTPEEPSEPSTVESVYADPKQKDPLVERLCAALHTRPRVRWAECCGEQPGVIITPECTRVLSSAVESGAIRLDAAAVERCERAVEGGLAGCGWVGTWQFMPPRECHEALSGGSKRGALCRSSLECEGEQRCFGLSATQAGRCAPAAPDGSFCGASTDPLAVYARIDDVDERHPPCAGRCDRGRCAPALALGEACTANVQCGNSARCAAGKCTAGARAKVGEACLGSGCEEGLRCVFGACISPKGDGAACTKDDECHGGCVTGGEGPGACHPVCDSLVNMKRVRKVLTSTAAR